MMCALKEMFNLTQQNCWSAAHIRTILRGHVYATFLARMRTKCRVSACGPKNKAYMTPQNGPLRTKIFTGYCPPFPSNHVEDQAKKYTVEKEYD